MQELIFWGFQTHFSMGESIIDPEMGVKRIKELGYTHVALADTMSVSALVTVAKACKKAELELITGCTLRVRHGEKSFWYPKVYIKAESALVRLYALMSTADKDKQGKRFITAEQLAAFVSDDVAVTSGSASGFFSSVLSDADRGDLLALIRTAYSAFGFVLELASVVAPPFAVANHRALSAGITRTIVNSSAAYMTPKDHDARDVMAAILSRDEITSKWARFGPKGRFMKAWADVTRELEESVVLGNKIMGAKAPLIVERSIPASEFTYKWSKKDPSLPDMRGAYYDEISYLVAECDRRFSDRVERPVFGYQPDPALLPDYNARLDYELGVIEKMGFANYFLLVAELVQWSKDNGIIVGPGRGSVGGSLIAFVMGITEVDPIRFNLYFERFINPGRKDLPDADLDFMSERRHEIIDHLKDLYGDQNVGAISNYNTLSGASAIRDVAKCLGVPEIDYNVSKMVPKEHGISVELPDALDMVPQLQAYAARHAIPWDTSVRLEGALRAHGQHAAGIVVSKDPLVNASVVEQRAKDLVINWDKRVSEEQGLVKIDVLGLSTLDVIERAFTKIKGDYGKTIDILDIPLDDRKVLDALGRGDTTGVFQVEGGGAKRLLKGIGSKVTFEFNDLVAINALNRPGPLDAGLADAYIRRKCGEEAVSYPHPRAEVALKDTFGVLVYQENTMRIAQDLSGFSAGDSDSLRSAIGKKDMAKMVLMKDQFVSGAVAGYVEIELEDGRKVQVHGHRKFSVKGRPELYTVQEIFDNDLELDEPL